MSDYKCSGSIREQEYSSPCPFSGEFIIGRVKLIFTKVINVEVDGDENSDRTNEDEVDAEVEIGNSGVEEDGNDGTSDAETDEEDLIPLNVKLALTSSPIDKVSFI